LTTRPVAGPASLVLAAHLGAGCCLASGAPDSGDAVRAADELYADGRDTQRDRQALAVLDRALESDPKSYELLWRASRALYQIADAVPRKEKRPLLDRAIEMAARAVAVAPDKVQGHYWLGASDGSAAEIRGPFKALSLVSELRSEMKAVLRIEPCYEQGDAFRALGELDMQLPWLLGGRKSRAIRRMEEGVRTCPANLDLRFSLATAYLTTGRREEGRRILEGIVSTPVDPLRPGADREIREKAARRLAKLD
jgi:tetratricopeptide (TPR) repeat protein